MQQPCLWYRRATMSLILAATLACDGGDDGPSGPAPSIQLTASPTSLTLQQGASGTVALTLARTNFSSPVSVAVSGLPAGVSASVSPASLTGATTTATVTVDVAASVAPGNYTATVAGSATGVGSASTTFALTVTAAPNVTLSLTPPTLTVQAGRSGNTSVTVTRTNFTGTLALSLDTPPAGITGSFNPVTVAADNSALTVNVALGVAPANYTLTIRATATGLGERTVALPLTVTAPPPGSIALAISPQSASVVQGSVGQSTLSITRTDFNGAVALAAAGAPAGVTVTFSETPTTASQVQLLYSTTLAAPVGTYTITVTATATGVSNATATFTLQITQAPPSSQVEIQFCSSSENPVFFAFQDGTGNWQPVTGTQSGGLYRYTFTLTQSRGGIFFVQLSASSSTPRWASGASSRLPMLSRLLPDAIARFGLAPVTTSAADVYETTVFYGTATELAAEGLADCAASAPTKTVSVQVTGLRDGEAAAISLGGVTEFVFNPSGSPTVKTVQLTDVRSGVIDLLAAREVVLAVQTDKLVDVRDLNPPDGSTLPFTIDFEGANAYAPASAPVTLANTGGDLLLFYGVLHTANGDVALIDVEHGVPPAPDVTRIWEGLPTARLKTGDVQSTLVLATPASTSTDETRMHMVYSTSVQAMTQTLGARLPTPTALSIGLPAYRRVRVQGALPAEYSKLVGATFGPSGGGNEITVIQTGAYRAAGGITATYDLSIPDLTALAGFPFAAGLPAGQIEVMVDVAGWTGTGTLQPVALNGTIFLTASKTVTVTVP